MVTGHVFNFTMIKQKITKVFSGYLGAAGATDGKEAAREKRRKFKDEFSTAFPKKLFVIY